VSLVEFIPSFSRGVSTSTARSCRTREECCKFDTPSPASDHRFDYLPLIDCAYGCAEQCLLVTVTVPLRSIGMFTSRQVLRFHQHVGCLLQVKSPFGGGDADGGQGERRHWDDMVNHSTSLHVIQTEPARHSDVSFTSFPLSAMNR